MHICTCTAVPVSGAPAGEGAAAAATAATTSSLAAPPSDGRSPRVGIEKIDEMDHELFPPSDGGSPSGGIGIDNE